MRCLTYAECAAWCVAHDYPIIEVDHYGRPAPAVLNSYLHFPLVYPEDSGRKVQLSRNVVSRLLTSGELLLWIGDWAVWPTSQHMPLFTRFRQAFGETRPLIEAPGHVVGVEQLEDAVSVLTVAMLFFWDCHVFTSRDPDLFSSRHMMSGTHS